MSARARLVLTRAGMLLLLVVSIDGAFTWYATDQAADVVEQIELRDGSVVTDDSTLGMLHRTEVEYAAANDAGRLGRARYLWFVTTLVGVGAVIASGSADRELSRSVLLSGAITVAIAVAPRLVYLDEISTIDAIFG